MNDRTKNKNNSEQFSLKIEIKEEKRNIYFGSTLKIFDPSKAVTYKLPSVSIVNPSGRKPGFLPFTLKSITTRSLAKKNKDIFVSKNDALKYIQIKKSLNKNKNRF